jgi:vancomycin resistance protein YoaR
VVVELARSPDDRSAELPGDVAPPELTADELEDMGVTEVVSSFTTDLVPGQPRNTNIHLAADYIDGDLIRPGETYSLNQGIGQRTSERGFVENGFIEEGELISVVGGGVSQMGTTFVNAAWFAGIRIHEFTPHSLYFTHYPMGREATISWGTLDVVVENDSPHAIMVLTAHTDSSVTVAFASSPWAEVDTWTGDPYDHVPGEERDGFTVDFGRDITYPDGSTSSESYTHTYQPDDG